MVERGSREKKERILSKLGGRTEYCFWCSKWFNIQDMGQQVDTIGGQPVYMCTKCEYKNLGRNYYDDV